MSRINLGRVAIGGLLAGLIINFGEFILNGVLLEEQMTAAMAALNKPPVDPQHDHVVRAVRLRSWDSCSSGRTRRCGRASAPASRPRSAHRRSCWGLAYLYPNLFMIIINLFPRDMMVMVTVWGLIEIIIAGIAGAWAYKKLRGVRKGLR